MAKKRAKSPTKSKGKARSKPKFNLSRLRKERRVILERPATVDPEWLFTEPPDPLDALVDASAQALELALDPEWRPAVRGNLDVTLRLAALFMDFPLPDEAEPAPVFVA
jgi:1-carboxybiuret hydrolase subunit AtzG-like